MGNKLNKLNKHVFEATTEERQAKRIHVTYSTTTDQYKRPSNGTSASGIKTWMYSWENICRKEESNSRDTYAYIGARDEQKESTMEWRFDAGDGQQFAYISILEEAMVKGVYPFTWNIATGSPSKKLEQRPDVKFVNTDRQAVRAGSEGERLENKWTVKGEKIVIVTGKFTPHPDGERVFTENKNYTVDPSFDIQLTLA